MKDLLQCNHLGRSGEVADGAVHPAQSQRRLGARPVVKFFGSRPKTPTCDKLIDAGCRRAG